MADTGKEVTLGSARAGAGTVSADGLEPTAHGALVELGRCLRDGAPVPEELWERLDATLGAQRVDRLVAGTSAERSLRRRREPDAPRAEQTAPPARTATGRRVTPPRTVLLIACVGVFMAFLDDTVVGIAFPNLLRSFPDASLGGLSWVLNSYNLALAALMVPAGRYTDVLGRRRVFVAGMALFTVASAACAVAPSLEALVAARTLQGIGAAIIIPASLALVLEAYPPERRGQAIAFWSATAALAAGIGPTIGGVLVDASNWRLVFLVNIPIGIVAVRAAGRLLVESRAPGRRSYPDLPGALVLALSVGLLTFAIVQGETWGWLSAGVALAVAGSLGTAVALFRRSRRHPSPVIDPGLMRMPGFSATGAVSLVGSAGFFGLGLANLLFLMQVWGYSPLVAGLAITPAPFAAAVTAGLVGKLALGRDARPLVFGGALVWAAGPILLLLRMEPQPDYLGAYLPAALLMAVGVGIVFPLVSEAAVSAAPGERYAGASALNGAIRQIGAALGIAIIAALVGHDAIAAQTDGFHRAWVFSSACFAAVAAGAWWLPRLVPLVLAPEERRAVRAAVARAPGAPRRTAPRAPRPPAPRTAAELLASVPLLSGLDDAALEALAGRTSTTVLPAGHWLFHRGDEADALYIVQSGRLQVVDDDDRVVIERSTGAVLGELGLVAGTPRSMGIRARRDARLLRLAREDFAAMMERPGFAQAVARELGAELQRADRPGADTDGAPTTIAVLAVGQRAASLQLAERLVVELQRLTTVAHLREETLGGAGQDIGTRLAETLDRCERDHDHVLLSAGTVVGERPARWTRTCIDQADRVLLVVASPLPAVDLPALPRACEVVLHDCAGDRQIGALLDRLAPSATHRLAAGPEQAGDARRLARRIARRSVGLVLSGGGARSFAQLGAIEELQSAGVVIDRVGGVSMGAFIGALLARGSTADEIDARCYEEWVRRRPLSDYRLPRVSLLRGTRALAMLERNLPGNIEDAPLSFYCASTDMIAGELVLHRRGPLARSVAASMCVPGLMPPVDVDGRLLVDGGVLDYLPVAAMAAQREGPIVACDTSEHEVRALEPGEVPVPPALPETLYKLVLLGSADPKAAGERADLLIRPDCEGTGLLEFHMIDRMREAGRRAAQAALERAPAGVL